MKNGGKNKSVAFIILVSVVFGQYHNCVSAVHVQNHPIVVKIHPLCLFSQSLS